MACSGSRGSGAWHGRPSTAIATLAVSRAADPGRLARCRTRAWWPTIRQLLQDSPVHGEGYRKLWARLRFAGIRTSRRRVLRLMREHGLLAHQRAGRPRGPRAHDGTITTGQVDRHVGHRPDLGDDRRGPGCGVHRRRSRLGRVRRHPCQPQRRSLRGPAADPAGGARALRHLRQASPTVSPSATIMAASMSATTSRLRSASSASKAHRLSCASPKAMAVPNGSSGC